MADYYPLIARAVAALDKSTGEARRALYERARNALVAQLRGVIPALSESDITRERLALEEAIRKVEGEAARRARQDAPRFEPPAARKNKNETPRPEERAAPTPQPNPPANEAEDNAAQPQPERPARPSARNRSTGERKSLSDEGLKDFRGVVADVEQLGSAAAQAARSARETYAAVPPKSRAPERPEGPVEVDRERPTVREPAQDHETESAMPQMLEPLINVPESRPMPPRRRAEPAPEEEEHPLLPQRNYAGLIALAAAVLVVLGLAGVAYWQRNNIKSLFVQTQSKPAPKPAVNGTAPTRPKIADRITPSGPPAPAANQSNQQQRTAAAAVAQRAVLYEEDPSNPQGKRFVGSVIWRTETVSPGPGQSPDLVIKANVEVPDRRLAMTFSLRRNADRALPASHTIEIMFNLPADFPGGGIANVPGVLMKQAEQTRGTPLAGLAVKVTTGFFLIGLSAVQTDLQRNMQLLKERSWFDIPVVYNNGTRAILAIEKGVPGERVFADAFRAWGQ